MCDVFNDPVRVVAVRWRSNSTRSCPDAEVHAHEQTRRRNEMCNTAVPITEYIRSLICERCCFTTGVDFRAGSRASPNANARKVNRATGPLKKTAEETRRAKSPSGQTSSLGSQGAGTEEQDRNTAARASPRALTCAGCCQHRCCRRAARRAAARAARPAK
jgi:hypothetical protein